jgi:Ca-activated chloride channel family protein
MATKPDYYTLLGVFRDATQEEIRRAYLKGIQKLHPDRNVAPGETELFLEVQQAYEVLSNPKRRETYDASLPKEERVDSPVSVEILYSRPSLVRMNEEQVVYVLLELYSNARTGQITAPPLNVCLVLDRSTSMKDAKMDLLKSAAIQFLRRMRPEDMFSVVTFSDKAEVVVPATLQVDRQKLEAPIRNIQPSGATEMYQGLKAGVDQVQIGRATGRVNHVILITDGHTYGDEAACLELASQAALQGIGISVMGIGTDWNDVLLDEVAARTGNTSRYIARPQDIQRFLDEKLHALTRIIADDTAFEFNLGENVRLNYAFRIQPETGPLPLEGPMPLGPILRDTHLSVVFEFIAQADSVKEDTTHLLDGQIQVLMKNRTVPTPPLRIRLDRPVHADPGQDPPPLPIMQALSRLTLYRMQERARHEAKAGEYEKATRSLKYLASHLTSQGEEELARTVLFEVENLNRKQTISQEGEKEIKYATRALI